MNLGSKASATTIFNMWLPILSVTRLNYFVFTYWSKLPTDCSRGATSSSFRGW